MLHPANVDVLASHQGPVAAEPAACAIVELVTLHLPGPLLCLAALVTCSDWDHEQGKARFIAVLNDIEKELGAAGVSHRGACLCIRTAEPLQPSVNVR
jgi:hypothetical protein